MPAALPDSWSDCEGKWVDRQFSVLPKLRKHCVELCFLKFHFNKVTGSSSSLTAVVFQGPREPAFGSQFLRENTSGLSFLWILFPEGPMDTSTLSMFHADSLVI